MKKTITLIVLLAFNMHITAQEPNLLDVDWILHYMEVDGTIFNVPQPHPSDPSYNPGIDFFDNGTGDITVTAGLTFNSYFSNGPLLFEPNTFMVEAGSVTLGDCYTLCDLEVLYLEVILLGDSFARAFEYEIINNGDEKILIITSPEGHKAVFGNFVLSTLNYDIADTFKAYPNLAKDEFIIESDHIMTNNNVSLIIRDINGRAIKKSIYFEVSKDSKLRINTSNLQAGVYFYMLESGKRPLKKGKLIKE